MTSDQMIRLQRIPKSDCALDECDEPHYAKGYCQNHYAQRKRRGEIPGRTCSFDECNRPHSSKGYCMSHRRQLDKGKELTKIRQIGSPDERFWAKVNKFGPLPRHAPEMGNCWVWIGSTLPSGYGQIQSDKKRWLAHRYVMRDELANSPGAVVDHMCFNKSCVRRSHLRLCSVGENQENLPGARESSSTGVRGVFYDPKHESYRTQVRKDGITYRLGSFKTLEEADKAVSTWRRRNMEFSLIDHLRIQPKEGSEFDVNGS